MAVFLIPVDTWYIVPYERMVRKNGRQCCTIHFTLGSKRQKYGDCREAFWRLRAEEKAGQVGCSG